ncbi:MAG TPA: GNAT family N-acetyltransferase [Opitutaceae bacterium]|nr:GNAT family N-acetyltransferase [Opitutaceae bacterium]
MTTATGPGPGRISKCGDADLKTIHEIINESASAYRGVIPADCWHEPYMPLDDLKAEIVRGVRFHGYRMDGELLGVMGIQDVKDVTLIRHAYVRSKQRGGGIGSALLAHLRTLTDRPVLIGTWRDATWAIAFYAKHGWRLAEAAEKTRLLRTYWTVPERQAEVSVVLVDGKWRRPVV